MATDRVIFDIDEENGIDPGFTPEENLIICDLINKSSYIDVLLAHRQGNTKGHMVEVENVPNSTALDPEQPIVERRPRVQDVIDWHKARPWQDPEYLTKLEKDHPCEDFDLFTVPDEELRAEYSSNPEKNGFDEWEPDDKDMALFLKKVSNNQLQREMLAVLAERFAGLLLIGTGRRVMQSLTMFVDFTVRKDKAKNLLMW